MTILAGDIKLVPSQVMSDVDEGGGAPGLGVINDGVSNAIFPDISELDRALGRVSLRKVFARVETNNNDAYMGANFIVADPPNDPNVSITLFDTGDVFDTRDDAKARLEAYLAPGPEYGAVLLENHIAGQRALQFFQRVNSETPTIGKTLLLIANEGLGTQYLQYVRVTRIAIVERTFTYDTDKDYQAWVVTVEISDPLKYDFPGTSANRAFARGTGKSMIRDTVVADAATYYGTVPLTAAVTLGALTAKGSGIYTQLVPSAQTEIPVVNALPNGEVNTLVQSATGDLTLSISSAIQAGTVIYTGNPITPGTLTIDNGSVTLTDAGGTLYSGAVAVGTVEYASGSISFTATSPTYSGVKIVTFKPAAAPQAVGDTSAIPVTAETRAYNYVRTLPATVAPGSLKVSYRAQGKWYDLRDDGSGALKGADTAYGSGTISYALGTLSVTLGALPDVGSQILVYWGAKASYINRSAVVPKAVVELQLALPTDKTVKPSGVTITWNDGTARTATDNGAGLVTGDATGTVDYQTGKISLTMANLPNGGQSFNVAYDSGDKKTATFTDGNVVSNTATVTLDPNVQPGSVTLQWTITRDSEGSFSYGAPARVYPEAVMDAYDDKLGNIKVKGFGTTIGTINYATGVMSFDVRQANAAKFPVFEYFNNWFGSGIMQKGYSDINTNSSFKAGSTGNVQYRSSSPGSAVNVTLTAGSILVDLTPDFAEPIIPGSINFTLGGRRYYDVGGALLYGLDPLTGSGTSGGTVDYASGRCQVTAYAPGQTMTVGLTSLLTTLDDLMVDQVTFRIPVSPVRPGSVQLIATLVDGTAVSVVADTDGKFTSTFCNGSIDYETGVGLVEFGQFFTAAGNESQPWYDASLVRNNGKIKKPNPAYAPTIRFNAVGYSYLPLDADILGIDPVRLPQDGRVPIFRRGGVAVIGHTASLAPATVTNGQTLNAGRTRLSRIRLIGNDGGLITTGYTTDLDAGTLTVVSTAGWSQPVTMEHRVEDMLLISDVQIDGTLTFTRPVTHNYPATGAYISSALLWGDVQSRASIMFDQIGWDSVWRDVISGSAALASYNNIQYPLDVKNAGAITERWVILFDNATNFRLIGEHLGQIATGNTSTDLAPVNPTTGVPYFTMNKLGWGTGWASGNIVRFNTVGATPPAWIVRTIQQGPETEINDSFTVLMRGDVDRP